MFNSSSKKFEEELLKLINASGLKVSEAYYIVENAALQLKLLYTELAFKEQMEDKELCKTKEQFVEIPIGLEENFKEE